MAASALCLKPDISQWTQLRCHQSFAGFDQVDAWCDDLLPELRRGATFIQEAFITHFWPLVEGEASHYGRLGGEIDDLKGEAALALWEAALSYSPGRHRTSLANYVKNQIHRRVRRAYLAQRGYNSGLIVVPLPIEAADQKDSSLSLTEWSLDLKKAFQSLSDHDRAALQGLSRHQGQSSRERKRRQRARHRLAKALKTPSLNGH